MVARGSGISGRDRVETFVLRSLVHRPRGIVDESEGFCPRLSSRQFFLEHGPSARVPSDIGSITS